MTENDVCQTLCNMCIIICQFKLFWDLGEVPFFFKTELYLGVSNTLLYLYKNNITTK